MLARHLQPAADDEHLVINSSSLRQHSRAENVLRRDLGINPAVDPVLVVSHANG